MTRKGRKRIMERKKKCWIYILIPLVAGAVAGMLSSSGMEAYGQMAKPPLSPPGWVFPVVWTILYILMGIAACLVAKSDDPEKQEAIRAFWIQLVVNVIWPILFFGLGLCGLAFAWLVLLWVLVFRLWKQFKGIDGTAGKLLVPYLLWLTFAGYLNLGICLMGY